MKFDRKILPVLFSLALPLIASNLLQQTYNMADAFFMGQFVDGDALAATGSCSTILLIIIYFFIGLSMGGNIVMAMAYGAKDDERMKATVHNTMTLAFVCGIGLSIFGVVTAQFFLKITRVPEEILSLATLYLRITSISLFPQLVYSMGSGLLRAVGDTRITMYSLALSCVVKLVSNVLFVSILNLGVLGAAITTILAQSVAAVIVLLKLGRSREVYRLRYRQMHFQKSILWDIISIGAPAGIQSVLQSFSNLYFQTMLNTFGMHVVTGYSAFSKVDGLVYMPIEGFALASSTLVGQKMGECKPHMVRYIFHTSTLVNVLATIVVSTLLIILAKPVLGLFITNDQQAMQQALTMVRCVIPMYALYAIIQTYANVLRGSGDARGPMLIVMICVCGLRVVWNTVFSKSLLTLYLSYPISWVVTLLVFLIYTHKRTWKLLP